MPQKNYSVLIVDDDPGIRSLLEVFLRPCGYKLLAAANGPEALEIVAAQKPDVILLDIMMPGMNGFEVCRILKADWRWQHIPILMITALQGAADMVRGLDAGADDFLRKPVDRLELQARVRSMLRLKHQFDELERALQFRQDLANIIVHDMRTPLASILGLSHLYGVRATTAEEVADARKLEEQARRMELFMTNMLLLAKTEQQRLELVLRPVEVKPLVEHLVETYRGIAETRGIKIVTDLPPQVLRKRLDVNLFKRVLENLLSNAVKWSPINSTISVKMSYSQVPNGNKRNRNIQLRVEIVDQGDGAPYRYRDRIFEKYEIAGLSQTGMSQVGFGLAFCKMAIEAHHGQIYVEENKPRGSRFVVEV